jgi:hypothetical protein
VKLYIAGPMSGIPAFNIPAFDKMARDLRSVRVAEDPQTHRELGYYLEVVSPAELDDPEVRAAQLKSPDGQLSPETTGSWTWGDFLARDLKLIADDGIEGIVVLPGWNKSRGARIETAIGHITKSIPIVDVAFYQDDPVEPPTATFRRIPMRQLVSAWAGINVADLVYGDV